MNPADVEASDEEAETRRSHHRVTMLAAGGYTFLSVIVWWNVWTTHPTATNCGCGDAPLFVWFIKWPAYAIAHGLNPLHSTALNYPNGVNLIFGEIYGVVLAPITWVFGPVASVNVLLTLAPASSALAMFALLRRWVSWAPAAFAGGLLYGFSPFVMNNITVSDANLALLVVPPLVVALLDDLLFRQPRHAAVTGLWLGLAMTLQFFLSAEYVVTLALMCTIAVALIAAFAAVRAPDSLRERAPRVVVGLVTSMVVAAVLLAVPAWYATAGPSHLPKHVWPPNLVAYSGTTIKGYVTSAYPTGPFSATFTNLPYARQVGGYVVPVLSNQFFGIGIVLVLVGGLIAWRRDLRLWLFGGLGALSILLSLGVGKTYPLPWNFIASLPLMENVFPYRLVMYTYLAAAVMLAVIIGHIHEGVNLRRVQAITGHADHRSQARLAGLPPKAGAFAATLVAAIALLTLVVFFSPTIPMPVRPVIVPTWFRTVGPHLGGHQVLLVFPVLWSDKEGTMTWQALDDMSYSMVGQGGAAGVISSLPKVDQYGAAVLAGISYPAFVAPVVGAAEVESVRELLDNMKVTTVVIPDQPGLPPRDRIYSVTLAASVITAATGQPPVHQASAWVWNDVQRAPTSIRVTEGDIDRCTVGLPIQGVGAVHTATTCVLAVDGRVPLQGA